MMIYIKSTDTIVWKVIKEGEIGLTKLKSTTMVPKPKNEWDEDYYNKEGIHAEAMNAILYVVTPSEFKKISKCALTKGMWDKIEITYNGTKQVKEIRISMLVYEYENFKMEESEKVEQMFERLFMIVNYLHALGRIIFERELNMKILTNSSKIMTI